MGAFKSSTIVQNLCGSILEWKLRSAFLLMLWYIKGGTRRRQSVSESWQISTKQESSKDFGGFRGQTDDGAVVFLRTPTKRTYACGDSNRSLCLIYSFFDFRVYVQLLGKFVKLKFCQANEKSAAEKSISQESAQQFGCYLNFRRRQHFSYQFPCSLIIFRAGFFLCCLDRKSVV